MTTPSTGAHAAQIAAGGPSRRSAEEPPPTAGAHWATWKRIAVAAVTVGTIAGVTIAFMSMSSDFAELNACSAAEEEWQQWLDSPADPHSLLSVAGLHTGQADPDLARRPERYPVLYEHAVAAHRHADHYARTCDHFTKGLDVVTMRLTADRAAVFARAIYRACAAHGASCYPDTR